MNIQFDLGDVEYVFAIQTKEKGLKTYSITYGESTNLMSIERMVTPLERYNMLIICYLWIFIKGGVGRKL